MRSGSSAATFCRSGSSCQSAFTPCSSASSAHWLKKPLSSEVGPALAPPEATTGASTASREPVRVTEVETIFSGLAGISTCSVFGVALPFSTTSESTVRGQVPWSASSESSESESESDPSAEAEVPVSESSSSSEQAATPRVRAVAAATAATARDRRNSAREDMEDPSLENSWSAASVVRTPTPTE